jgi:hypothetical protein
VPGDGLGLGLGDGRPPVTVIVAWALPRESSIWKVPLKQNVYENDWPG